MANGAEPLTARILLTFQDDHSGLKASSVLTAANYGVTRSATARALPKPVLVTGVQLLGSAAVPTGPLTAAPHCARDSEWDLVLADFSRRLYGWPAFSSTRVRARIRLRVGRRSEELQGPSDDLHRLAFAPVHGLVLPPLQPPFYRDRPALG